MKKILAIDGGGIRGIIPAILLDAIEKRTGKHIAELFDLIAGTSTGGILALGLNKPDSTFRKNPKYTAEELAGLYLERGKEIFPIELHESGWGFISSFTGSLENVWSLAGSLGNLQSAISSLGSPKYPCDRLEKILDNCFGETRLSESLKDVIVTSYDIEHRCPQIFSSTLAKSDTDENFLMREVARATSAAPTYFEPSELGKSNPLKRRVLIDGGVFASNPTLYAYVEARQIYRNADDFLVVSIGTGGYAPSLLYEQAKKWGLLQWGYNILNVVADGVSTSVDFHLKNLLPKDRYYRFQVDIKSADEQIDNAKPENVRSLQNLGSKMIQSNEEMLEKVCDLLTQ